MYPWDLRLQPQTVLGVSRVVDKERIGANMFEKKWGMCLLFRRTHRGIEDFCVFDHFIDALFPADTWLHFKRGCAVWSLCKNISSLDLTLSDSLMLKSQWVQKHGSTASLSPSARFHWMFRHSTWPQPASHTPSPCTMWCLLHTLTHTHMLTHTHTHVFKWGHGCFSGDTGVNEAGCLTVPHTAAAPVPRQDGGPGPPLCLLPVICSSLCADRVACSFLLTPTSCCVQ